MPRGFRVGTKIGVRAKMHQAGERFGHLTVLRLATEADSRNGLCWLCRCDCGNEKIIPGPRLRYEQISCGCRKFRQIGEESGKWKGGRYTAPNGYVYVRAKGHPNANKRGYALEHTIVMAEMIGRPLRKGESVHHKNGIKTDNRPENLELWASCGKGHKSGQRVSDLIAYALEILRAHGPEYLRLEHVESGQMMD